MFANYPDYEPSFAQIQLVLFMVGMGATLSPQDFSAVFRQPVALGVALVLHLLVLPLVAVGLGHWFTLEPGIALGLLLVAAMPGGTLSKVFTYLARGNVALSASLSGCTSLACLATVPVVLQVLAGDYVPANFRMPVGHVVSDVVLFLLLPVVVGMQLRRWLPGSCRLIAAWCIRLGLIVVVIMITGSIGSGRIDPWQCSWKTGVGIILFCLLAQQLAMLPFRLYGWKSPDVVAVGIESTMRNMNLALLLKTRLFPDQAGAAVDPIGAGVFFVILYYAAVALIAGTPLALRMRGVIGRERARLAAASGSAAGDTNPAAA